MFKKIFALLVLTFSISGCFDSQDTGAEDVRWDVDGCERCRMVVSSPNFAAQVRYFPKDKRSKVIKFDDIGCAVIWLEDKEFKNNPKTEIWVTDYNSKKWINALTATYIYTKTSPMEYGMGAVLEPQADGLDFNAAKEHIFDIEKRFNLHGTRLEERGLKEQAIIREKQQ